MATVPSREVSISALQTAIAAAEARDYDNVCIGQLDGDIVLGKDVGPSNGPRELEGEVANKEGTAITLE